MAVENKYVNALLSATTGQLLRPSEPLPAIKVGAELGVMFETFEVAAADSDGSIYRVFKGVDGNLIPLAILIASDGITGGTVYDVGLYDTDLGTVIDADCFAANLDLSSAADFGFATAIDGLDAVAIEDMAKRIFEHAAHTILTRRGKGYDIALTGDTVGTGAGTISVLMIYAKG